MSRRYVTKEDNILHDENNLVHLHCADGEAYESLEPRRLFPINRPNEYITLLDKEGKEIAVIRSIEQINEDSRRVIHDSLEDYYLVPEITRIVNTIEKYGRLHWQGI